MTEIKDRLVYIDILRILSIFSVIVIHSATSIYTKFNSVSIDWWIIGDFYASSSRWAVPIMVMIGGTLLLDKDYTIKTFFKKRFNRVLIPFLFWGIIYTIWIYWNKIIASKPLPWFAIIKSFITGPVYYHLWFVYMIFGIYLVTPILRVYVKNADLDNIKYFLIIWFISNGIIAYTDKIANIKISVETYFFTGYVGYFLLGYYLNKIRLNKKQIGYIYIIGLIGLMITVIGTTMLSIDKGNYVRTFNRYLGPSMIMVSIGIFVFIKNIKWDILLNNERLNKIIIDASAVSFGVYLIHALILDILRSLNLDVTLFNPILSIPLMAIGVAIISYTTIKLMKKLPIIGRVVA